MASREITMPVDPSTTWSVAALPIGACPPVPPAPVVLALELALAPCAVEPPRLELAELAELAERAELFDPVDVLVLGPLPAPDGSSDSPQPTNAAPAAKPDRTWRRV